MNQATNYNHQEKLLQINSNNQFLVGIIEFIVEPSLSAECSDTTFYFPANNLGPQQVIKSCENCPLRYTRFVLLFPNDNVLNVGWECKEA